MAVEMLPSEEDVQLWVQDHCITLLEKFLKNFRETRRPGDVESMYYLIQSLRQNTESQK